MGWSHSLDELKTRFMYTHEYQMKSMKFEDWLGQNYIPYEDGYRSKKDLNINKTEDTVSNAVDPKHYKGLLPSVHPNNKDWEYIEIMEYLLKDFDGIKSHLLGQVYKYLMRNGKKDNEIQELKKAQWYLDRLIKSYEKN